MSKKTSPKTRGTNFERRIRKFLEERGWAVFRSAGSRTSADLIAIKHYKEILAVQCKASDKPSISKLEKEGLLHLETLGVRSLVICRNNVNYAIEIYEMLPGGGLQMTFDWP